LNEVMSHLEVNLYSKTNEIKTFCRNLMLHGLKGSGKSTLCKYICNKISSYPLSTVYFYINCQNFMSKTPDTIYEQLKFVYQECLYYENLPCLVVLENIDLLIENKANSNDPSSMLYYAQIVECKEKIFH
jgi:ABC-type multidrug transport system ATPase subunit